MDTSHWRLTGAARPADSLPGAGGTELIDERDPWEAGEDLFEKLGGGDDGEGGKNGSFYDGPEACREYLRECFLSAVEQKWREGGRGQVVVDTYSFL